MYNWQKILAKTKTTEGHFGIHCTYEWYGWRPPLLPSQYICDKSFTVEHALSCLYGGFPMIRHNEVRDITVHLMSDAVCHKLCWTWTNLTAHYQREVTPQYSLVPSLRKPGDEANHSTANTEDGTRVDIKAQGFWENDRQCEFFDVNRVFFLIPSHTPIVHSHSPPATDDISKKRLEEGLWPTYKRSGAWLLFTPRFLSLRRDGSYCQIKWCTRSWHQWLQPNITSPTARQSTFSLFRYSSIMCIRGHGHQQTNQLSHICLKLQLIVPSAIAEWPLTELLHSVFISSTHNYS